MKHKDTPSDKPNDEIIEGEIVEPQSDGDTAAPASDDSSTEATEPPTLTDAAPEEAEPAASSAEAEPAANATPEAEALSPAEETVTEIPATAAAAAAAAPKTARSKLAILALVLALIALATLGYGYTLVQQLHQQMQSETGQLAQGVQQSRAAAAAADQRAVALEQQLTQSRQQLSTQQNNLNELQDRLTRAMQQISTIGTDSRRDWLLAEVEYLLRLANQRVLMENSASGALSLLQSADKILQETDDVSLYNVRKALAEDIAALEAVPTLDVDGTFLRLAALNGQVDSLRLLPVTDRHQLPAMLKEITPEAVEENWQAGMANAWAGAMEKLGNLIVIQHRDEPVQPLLSPEQHFFLQQNLHLMLEQAQLALLQGKQAAFDTSLDKAHRWIGTYFQQDDSTTQALLKGIEGVKATRVAPTLPDISGSLNTLKTYLAAQLKGKGAA